MRLLLAILRPLRALSVIADELRTLRQLKELELAHRDEPERALFRVTERPKEEDTEVSYADVSKGDMRRWEREKARVVAEWARTEEPQADDV